MRRCTYSALVLLLAPRHDASAAVVSLDGEGVAAVMSGARAAVVKFTSGKTDEHSSLNALWAKLESDFYSTGLLFASVDCSVHPAACEARKLDPAEMTAPVVKFWMPAQTQPDGTPIAGSFRRYAGLNEFEPMRTYLG